MRVSYEWTEDWGQIKLLIYFVFNLQEYEFFTLGTDDPKYNLFDASNFEIIPENDTHTFLNGSLKVLVDISSPWFLHTHLEHHVQGKWLLQAFTKNISDFCPELKSPLQPWYYATKNLKGCPIPAGVSFLNINKYDCLIIEIIIFF